MRHILDDLGLKEGEADRTADMRGTEIRTDRRQQGKPVDKRSRSLKFCKKHEVCVISLFNHVADFV